MRPPWIDPVGGQVFVTQSSDVKAGDGSHDLQRQLLKLVLEVGPLCVFFVVTSLAGVYAGTACFVPATILALGASRLLLGRIPVMPLVSGVFVIIFGGLTLYLHDDLFIKVKPTIINGLFAVLLFWGLSQGRSWLKYLFADAFHLTDEGWRILTFRWACYFSFLAVLNELVWRNMSPEFWSGFKLLGVMPLTIIFTIAQVGLLKKHEASAN